MPAYVYRSGPSRLRPLAGGADLPFAAAPLILSVVPGSGAVGDTITINGTGFTGASSVTFGGVSATFAFINDATILATIPVGAVTGVVQVATTAGVGTSAPFTITATPPPSGITPPSGFATLFEDQMAFNSGRWSVYDNNTFGAGNNEIQRWMAYNTSFGPTVAAGAMGGTSLKMKIQREAVGGNAFTAGMVDTKTASFWLPRYLYAEFAAWIPHGHGLWPAIWLTAKNGGATMSEWDWLEYFHGELPGKNSSTLHGTQNDGTFHTNRYTNNANRTFFEAPTYAPGRHVWATEILPVTDSGGLTVGDLTQPNTNVRFRVLLDGTEVYRFVDTSALYWTTNGGSASQFWNVYMQGCQIDGPSIGHPDGPLAYSEQTNACLISGSPGACVTTRGGYNVQRAGRAGSAAFFGSDASTYDPATTLEVDYFYCATPTG